MEKKRHSFCLPRTDCLGGESYQSFSKPLLVHDKEDGLLQWLSGKESCNAGDLVWPLGQEHPLEKKMATHCSILAWEISLIGELGGLQSKGSQKVRHDWVTNDSKEDTVENLHVPCPLHLVPCVVLTPWEKVVHSYFLLWILIIQLSRAASSYTSVFSSISKSDFKQ